jgi:hypothetical protein
MSLVTGAGKSEAYTVSVERVDPRLPYTETNVVLICRGLNFGVKHSHTKEFDERDLLENRVWNQAYWNESMGMTPDVLSALERARKETRDDYLLALSLVPDLWDEPVGVTPEILSALERAREETRKGRFLAPSQVLGM